jgi:2,4-dienoyl-CoA reductase-like NADH-dependent reductase (Old Yellow Enzyme family)
MPKINLYLHVIERDTIWRNCHSNNGFDKLLAEKALADGRADLIAFGRPFIATPDFVIRLFLNAPLAPLNQYTLYGGAEHGYWITPYCVAPLTTLALAM